MTNASDDAETFGDKDQQLHPVVGRRAPVLAGIAPAAAHPHIFVDAKAAITFDDAGRAVSVHNSWTFDEAYSSWAVEGLDKNLDGVLSRDELQPMADDNLKGLGEYGYYMSAGEGQRSVAFVEERNAVIDLDQGRATLSFDVSFERPYAIRNALELGISDPQYYIAISFPDGAVQLIQSPEACTLGLEKPHDMPDDVAAELYALPPDIKKLPPRLEQALRGVQGGIVVACPGGSVTGGQMEAEAEAATALEAIDDLMQVVAPDQTASNGPSVIPDTAKPEDTSRSLRVVIGAGLAVLVVGGLLVYSGRRSLRARRRQCRGGYGNHHAAPTRSGAVKNLRPLPSGGNRSVSRSTRSSVVWVPLALDVERRLSLAPDPS